ncbi:MAG: UDP-3-O-(3-hydroxymyristoyl)glucosamine N-acyltransferase [Gammaproteobacteria bacterium]|nr:UDP-3-O-(3-hydroxymyristoyl)glucosamine N-acyltransferase [Gammaproteobacteria bacterium]
MQQPQQKSYTLAQLCHGLDVEIQGDPTCVIQGICTIQQGLPGKITFLMNPLYRRFLSETKASAIILSAEHAKDCQTNAIISRDPYYTWTQVAAYFDNKPRAEPGIHPSAVVGEHCQIDPSASVGANCVIGDYVTLSAGVQLHPGCVIGEYSEIGQSSCLEANVTVSHRIIIGERVTIGSGTVIGSDGFGIAKHKGVWHKVPQLGRVVIHDDVELGSNCSVDRGAIDDTILGRGVRIDNLVQIGHNVQIGEHTAIAGCVGISGSTVIGSNCMIGGQAGFAGHITIADNVVITGGTEVTKSIQQPGIYSSGVGGLVTNQERRKNTARVHRLAYLQERVKMLENALKELSHSLEK